MGQITIPSDDNNANVEESETSNNSISIASQRQQQQQIEDDAVYSDMENAIQTTDNTHHDNNDDLRTEVENLSSNTVEETMGSNNIRPNDEESQAVAATYNDMDRIIKDKANTLLPAAIKPPVPPGRTSAQAEEMIDALEEGDDLAVANKIAKEKAGAKSRDTDSSAIMTPLPIQPPLPPGRISAQAEEMIDALEGGELTVAKMISNERADPIRDTALKEPYEVKVQRKIRDGAHASAREEDSCTTTPAQNESDNVRPGIRPTPRYMLPRQDTDEKSANTNTPVLERKQTPILEASLVPEIPLYEATLSHVNTADNVAEVPWYRKRQGILLIVCTLVFGGAMATTGALLGASGIKSDDNGSSSSDDGNYLTAGSDDVGTGIMSISPTQSPVGFVTPDPDKTQSTDQVADSTASELDTDGPTTSKPSTPVPSTSKPSTLKPTTPEPITSKPTATPSTQAPTVTLYYPDWSNDRCISDVSGRPGPGQGQTMFVSVEACCKAEFWHLQHEDHNECIMNSLGLTHGPTVSPSSKPTSSPSKQSSRQPSKPPSKKPSQSPSMEPSSKPTSKPSDKPTSKPSDKPTSKPSGNSTMMPTRCPRESMDLCCLGVIPPIFASHQEYCQSLGCNGRKCGEFPPPI